MKKIQIIAACIIFLISTTVSAHHPSGGAGLGKAGPIRTISSSTLQKGRWALGIQAEFTSLDDFSDSELNGYAGSGKDVHSVDSIFHTIFGLGYGMTDDLTISMKIPYAVLKNIREVHAEEPDEIHVHGKASGIGDLTLLGQYRFAKIERMDFSSSLLLGLKVPTGKTNDKDIDGERFEAEFQPGSGSWNPIAGITAMRGLGKLSLDADALFTISTKGSQETDLGDSFNYDLAVSYRAISEKKPLDLILELNGEWKDKEERAGVRDDDSGGNIIFLSPGIRLSLHDKWSVFISAGFPIIQDLNGIQNETVMRILAGISMGL